MISLRSGLCILASTRVSLQKVVPLGIHTNVNTSTPGDKKSQKKSFSAQTNKHYLRVHDEVRSLIDMKHSRKSFEVFCATFYPRGLKYPALVLLSYLASLQPPFNFLRAVRAASLSVTYGPALLIYFNFYCRLPAPPLRGTDARALLFCAV